MSSPYEVRIDDGAVLAELCHTELGQAMVTAARNRIAAEQLAAEVGRLRGENETLRRQGGDD